MSADSMKEMFNFLCLKNVDAGKNFYCMQKFTQWEAAGAFKDNPTQEFPDPCLINCDTPTGKGIAELGCCMGSMMHAMEKMGDSGMSAAEMRAAKAAMYKCGGTEAFKICNGTGTGLLVPTELLQGKRSVSTCPANPAQAKEIQVLVANGLGVKTSEVSLITCKPATSTCDQGSGTSGGRRMEDKRHLSASNTMEYTVTITASDSTKLAAQRAAVTAKVATVQALPAVTPVAEYSGPAPGASPAGSALISKASKIGAAMMSALVIAFMM